MKILTVDDSKTLRKIVKRTIEDLKYECLEANDPKEALDVLSANHKNICLILLDWNMPEMTGIEFLEIIKNIGKYKEIPVIMLTSQSGKDNVIMAMKKGAANYVIKPFNQHDLSARIMSVLNKES